MFLDLSGNRGHKKCNIVCTPSTGLLQKALRLCWRATSDLCWRITRKLISDIEFDHLLASLYNVKKRILKKGLFLPFFFCFVLNNKYIRRATQAARMSKRNRLSYTAVPAWSDMLCWLLITKICIDGATFLWQTLLRFLAIPWINFHKEELIVINSYHIDILGRRTSNRQGASTKNNFWSIPV